VVEVVWVLQTNADSHLAEPLLSVAGVS